MLDPRSFIQIVNIRACQCQWLPWWPPPSNRTVRYLPCLTYFLYIISYLAHAVFNLSVPYNETTICYFICPRTSFLGARSRGYSPCLKNLTESLERIISCSENALSTYIWKVNYRSSVSLGRRFCFLVCTWATGTTSMDKTLGDNSGEEIFLFYVLFSYTQRTFKNE